MPTVGWSSCAPKTCATPSPKSARAYLAEADIVLEPRLVERLVKRTEGWIAGLQLAALSLRDRPNAFALVEVFAGSQRFVLDYLAEEVLAGLDDDLRSFLVQTSIADRFDAGLSRALTDRREAEALLARAVRANPSLSRWTASGIGTATTTYSLTTCVPSRPSMSAASSTSGRRPTWRRRASAMRRSAMPLPPARSTW